ASPRPAPRRAGRPAPEGSAGRRGSARQGTAAPPARRPRRARDGSGDDSDGDPQRASRSVRRVSEKSCSGRPARTPAEKLIAMLSSSLRALYPDPAMALDPNRWTIKTQEAFTQATEAARANSNPEVTPDHLLAALLRQEEGVVLPILNRVGRPPLQARNAADEAVAKLPKSYGSDVRLSRELQQTLDDADVARAEMGDEYLSTEHLLLALADRLGVKREDLL